SLDTEPAGFAWIDPSDAANNVLSFVRTGSDGSVLACISNFSPVVRDDYRMGLPSAGRWDEVINTDGGDYAGSGVGNLGGVETAEGSWHGHPVSASLRLPPLGTIWLRPAR